MTTTVTDQITDRVYGNLRDHATAVIHPDGWRICQLGRLRFARDIFSREWLYSSHDSAYNPVTVPTTIAALDRWEAEQVAP
jgi:hypothetical protein